MKNNKSQLWNTNKKSNSKINVRRLFPLFIHDIDGNPFDWCLTLEQRLTAGEPLLDIKKDKDQIG